MMRQDVDETRLVGSSSVLQQQETKMKTEPIDFNYAK
jgi:hypothetical protein